MQVPLMDYTPGSKPDASLLMSCRWTRDAHFDKSTVDDKLDTVNSNAGLKRGIFKKSVACHEGRYTDFCYIGGNNDFSPASPRRLEDL